MKRTLLVLSVLLASSRVAAAQQVLNGDPVDASTGLAYPVQPGLPLLLPGDDEKFGTGDDVVDNGIVGDVDIVVRSGSFAGSAIPAPSQAAGAAPVVTVVAGGGTSGQGAEAPFTVALSDGSGSYGNVVANSDMDLRPVTVYAFADLDGDGRIGPTSADGSADNALEQQEATAYAGRQMGTIWQGRFEDSLGLEIAAPASIGGLGVSLVAGAWTGTDPSKLFTDGPFILTHWPFFPPLDPKRLLGGGTAPTPDPELPNQLQWDIERNWLPSPGTPGVGTPFAVAVDGSEATTDQLVVDSAPASSLKFFAEPVAAKFLSRARPRLRVAPPAAASGRVLVLPVERAVLAADGSASTSSLRLLPVDLFANVADPASPIVATLSLAGDAAIVSPDTDANLRSETVSIDSAAGRTIVLDDLGSGSATLVVSIAGNPVLALPIQVAAAADSDGDGVADDGNTSGIVGDRPCDAAAASCDDNCPRVINPSQVDSDHDGIGDCCDGSCLLDPAGDGCGECALPVDPNTTTTTTLATTTTLPASGAGVFSSAELAFKSGGGTKPDKLTAKLSFDLGPDALLAPDAETLLLDVQQAGSAGYTATLASLLTDLAKSTPGFRYVDRSGAVDGVVKAQLKGDGNGRFSLLLRARGIALGELLAGSASLSLAIGDDAAAGTLSCGAVGSRLRCSLVP